MKEPYPTAPVDDRYWQQALDEVAGAATPPDRLRAILARADAPAARRRWRAGVGPRLWAAALLVLGIGVTIVAGVLQRAGGAAVHPAPEVVVAPGLKRPGPATVAEVAPTPVEPQATPPAGDAAASARPRGTDPEDLRVLRSEEAMRAAEVELAARLREGGLAGADRLVRFEELGSWDYVDGLRGMPASVKGLAGQDVAMVGFMLPIDEVEGMREFLLVASLWSCCYGTPPSIHQVVRCVMPAGKAIDYQFEPILVTGRLDVRVRVEEGYCIDIFQLEVDRVDVLTRERGPERRRRG